MELAVKAVADYLEHFNQNVTVVQADVFRWFNTIKTSKKYEGQVNLILTDPPYNILKDRRNGRSLDANDFISDQNMQDFCEMCRYLLHERGTGLIYCHENQIVKWKTFLSNANLQVEAHSVSVVLDPAFVPRNKRSSSLVNVIQHVILFHKSKDYYRLNDLKGNAQGELPYWTNCILGAKSVRWSYLRPISSQEYQDQLWKEPARFILFPELGDDRPVLNVEAPKDAVDQDDEDEEENEAKSDAASAAANKKLRVQEKSDDYYRRFITTYSEPNDLVFDGFAGKLPPPAPSSSDWICR